MEHHPISGRGNWSQQKIHKKGFLSLFVTDSPVVLGPFESVPPSRVDVLVFGICTMRPSLRIFLIFDIAAVQINLHSELFFKFTRSYIIREMALKS